MFERAGTSFLTRVFSGFRPNDSAMPVRVIALAAKERLLKSVFISLVLLYAVLLLTEPALGPSDEYAFLPTLDVACTKVAGCHP